ncbi:hypothetical protein HDK90DRAFT_74945 [Phyllosticta capitalensis]|uniref:DUF3752 domain-containing protein n=1 Tax=Phyllosticta capitalensis TaxID=121624 RepID=A0ABR1YD16_9PEZI
MTIGPTLPPHLLAKRKRDGDDEDSSSSASSSPPKNTANRSRSSSPDGGEKRRRVLGPAPPPAPLDEMPKTGPNGSESDSDSSSDDDFGPAPPTAAEAAKAHAANQASDYGLVPRDAPQEDTKQNQRDEWMMLPPDADGLASSRMDPTKLRARGFQSGRAARAAGSGNTGGGDMSTWTETPEQKRKRLENQVMGVAAPEGKRSKGSERDVKSKQDEETARRLREKNVSLPVHGVGACGLTDLQEKARGPSLLEQHKGKAGKEEEEDDPSKRAFDREKDMAVSSRMGHKEKQQMFSRMKDFGSQFSGGKYL